MARPEFKKWWTRIVPESVERSTYVLVSSIAMGALFTIFAWPLWAFSVLTLDILVIYGLLTHGDELD